MNIQLCNISRTYNSPRRVKDGVKDEGSIHALRGVNLVIPTGGIFGIIGKSGAGKSTLVRVMSLLERADSGEVLFDGERVDTLTSKALYEKRRHLGMIFQNFNLFSSRTAGGNVAYPMEICGESRAHIKERVEELLELVGLSDKKDASISTLSGGQKQRVAIARALARNPDVLFCDEATSALDPQTTKSILLLIRDIQKRMALTVVMITHQMEVVRDSASLVAVIDKGQVVETGTTEDIFLHPKSETTREFLAGMSANAPIQGAGVKGIERERNAIREKEKEGAEEGEVVRWSEGGGYYILRFKDSLTDEPVLSLLAKNFGVQFNIRAGGVQHLQSGKVGTLLVDISGERLSEALEYLKKMGVVVEHKDSGKSGLEG